MAGSPAHNCHECGKTMEHEYIIAGRCVYHPDCVKCRHCHKKLDSMNIYVINNGPYCSDHRGSEVGVNEQCPGCKKKFRATTFVEQITIAGVAYHKECIKCATCKKDIEPDQCKAHENALYCDECYDSKNPKKCQKCKNESCDQAATTDDIQIVIHPEKGYDDVYTVAPKEGNDNGGDAAPGGP